MGDVGRADVNLNDFPRIPAFRPAPSPTILDGLPVLFLKLAAAVYVIHATLSPVPHSGQRPDNPAPMYP